MPNTTIWKFSLPQRSVQIPRGARIIHAGLDPNEDICIWAEVDPDAELVSRAVSIVGTGGNVPASQEHVGSFLYAPYVWHVYAEKDNSVS